MRVFFQQHWLPQPAVVLVLGLLWPWPATAQPVQKWQDAHGQWHFGDAAAAGNRRTQPVYIKQRISVVHQDHATPNVAGPAPSSRARRVPKQAPAKKPPNLVSDCAQLQARTRVPAPLAQQRQAHEAYERACIRGHFYGASSLR